MIPYILLCLILILFPFVSMFFRKKERYTNVYCAVVFIFILLIFGLRHPSMGMDLPGYLKSYIKLSSYSWKELVSLDSYLNYEKGYVFLNKIVGVISNINEQALLISCAILSIIPAWYSIRKKSDDILLSVAVYLGLPIFILQFSGLRQSIAIGICIFALDFIEKKKIIRFAITVLFACLFHSSAIIFIFAYLIYYIKISSAFRLLTLTLFPIIYIFRQPIFLIISSIFKDNVVLEQTNATSLMLAFLLIYVVLIILSFNKIDERINGYMNLFLCACLGMIFSEVYSTAMRAVYYFMFPLVLLLPLVLSYKQEDDWRVPFAVKSFVVIGFLWFFFDCIMDTYWAMAYPYYTFWEDIYLN